MKKGMVFIFIIAVIYWGYYFTRKNPPRQMVAAGEIKAPIEEVSLIVHNANLNILQTSIEIFGQEQGRLPHNLTELVDKGYLSKLPDSGGFEWQYNSENGSVN